MKCEQSSIQLNEAVHIHGSRSQRQYTSSITLAPINCVLQHVIRDGTRTRAWVTCSHNLLKGCLELIFFQRLAMQLDAKSGDQRVGGLNGGARRRNRIQQRVGGPTAGTSCAGRGVAGQVADA